MCGFFGYIFLESEMPVKELKCYLFYHLQDLFLAQLSTILWHFPYFPSPIVNESFLFCVCFDFWDTWSYTKSLNSLSSFSISDAKIPVRQLYPVVGVVTNHPVQKLWILFFWKTFFFLVSVCDRSLSTIFPDLEGCYLFYFRDVAV